MAHRAEQIIDAVAAALQASATLNCAVYTHRAETLSEAEGELPAVSVDFGEDEPLDEDGASNFSFIDSLLSVETTIYLQADDEALLRAALLNRRTAIHIAVMTDRSFGLAFVIDTRYGGADAPEFAANAETIVGRLVCRWRVHYRMNISDPS